MSLLKCVKCGKMFEGDQFLVCQECYNSWIHDVRYQYYVKLEDSYLCLCNKHLNFDIEKCPVCGLSNPGVMSPYSYMEKEILNYVLYTRFISNNTTEKIINRLFDLNYQYRENNNNKIITAYYLIYDKIFETVFSKSSNRKLLIKLFETRKPSTILEIEDSYDRKLISNIQEVSKTINYCRNEDVYRIIFSYLEEPSIMKKGNKKFIYDGDGNLVVSGVSNSKLLMKFLTSKLWERKKEKIEKNNSFNENNNEALGKRLVDNNPENLRSFLNPPTFILEEHKEKTLTFEENDERLYPGDRIRNFRIDNDLSQTELANIVGKSQVKISKIENKIKNITTEEAEKLAEYMKVSPEQLLKNNQKEVWNGRTIKRLRKRKGFTQIELGRETGIWNRTISEIEKGYHKPYIETIKRLAVALGVEVSDII